MNILADFFVRSEVQRTYFTLQGDHQRAHAPEVASIQKNTRTQQWEIELRRKRLTDKLDLSEEEIEELFIEEIEVDVRQRLAQQLENWWAVIDNELMQQRLPLAIVEQQQHLGTYAAEIAYWQLPDSLSEKQKAVLCYFLPYADQVRGNQIETAYILTTFLEMPVQISTLPTGQSKTQRIEGTNLTDWTVGLRDIIGGDHPAQTGDWLIRLELSTPEKLLDFLPYAPQRWLLEKVVLPLFLPTQQSFRIELQSSQPIAFSVGDTTSRVGYNNIAV